MRHHPITLSDDDVSVSDEYLWERFRQEDRRAYQQLYVRHLNALYNYGYKVLPNESVVADQIQDLFIDLWKYKVNLTQVKDVKHYLFRSLRNRIVKAIRQNRYTSFDLQEEHHGALIVLPFENKIIENQTRSETTKKLQRAFLVLSKRQREVINLLFYEKFSYEEVAGIMNINLRSAYTLAWKALAVLRKELSCLVVALFF